MKPLRITRIGAVLLTAAATVLACGTGPTDEIQVLRGRVTAADVGAPVVGVRVMQGQRLVASRPVADDGSFTIEVPVGSDYRLEVVSRERAHGVAVHRGHGTRPMALFDVCEAEPDVDLGDLDSGGDGNVGWGSSDGDCLNPPPPCADGDGDCVEPCFEDEDGVLICGDPVPPCDEDDSPFCDDTPPPPCFEEDDGSWSCDDPPPPPCFEEDDGSWSCDDTPPPPCFEEDDGSWTCDDTDPPPPPCFEDDEGSWTCDDTDPPPPPCFEDDDGSWVCVNTDPPPCDPDDDGTCGWEPGCGDPENCDEPDAPCGGADTEAGWCDDICMTDPDLCWPTPDECSYDDPMCWPEACVTYDGPNGLDGDPECFDIGLVPDNPLPLFGCELGEN